jgi:xylose isomerase
MVLGKRMEDHLRVAVCYWHSFAWQGGDPFGGQTFLRPWFEGGMEAARLKAEVAFEMLGILGVPFFTFHDRDAAPEEASLQESTRNLRAIAEVFARRMEETGSGCCGGRRTCSRTGATWRGPRPTPIRRSSPTRRLR